MIKYITTAQKRNVKMNTSMKSLLLLLFFTIQIKNLQAQHNDWQTATKQEIIASYQKTCAWFINTSNYNFKMKYTSYKDHVSNEVFETSNGYYKRSGNNFKSETVGIKMFQNSKARLIIDTADQAIVVLSPTGLKPVMTDEKELGELLEKTKSLKKKKVGKGICYRIEFNKNDLYEAFEFTVDEKNLFQALVYYYSEQTEENYDNPEVYKPTLTKVKPRLEILFTNYLYPVQATDSEFQDKLIVLQNNKVDLLGKYKNYQVKDYRLQSK